MRSPDIAPPTSFVRPEAELKRGDFAMIKTTDGSTFLDGVGVTIKGVTYVHKEKSYRYTCAGDELGGSGTTISVAEKDLVKAKYKIRDTVTISTGRPGHKHELDGTVRAVEIVRAKSGWKFEYVVYFGEKCISEENIKG